MLKEVSIVNILKDLRVLKAVVKESKTEHEWKLLNDDCALMAYSDLDSEPSSAAQSNNAPERLASLDGSFQSIDLSELSSQQNNS